MAAEQDRAEQAVWSWQKPHARWRNTIMARITKPKRGASMHTVLDTGS